MQPRIQSLIAEKLPRLDEEAPIGITPDVFFLGKAGVYRLPSGLRVAVAGGYWDPSKWSESTDRNMDEVEVRDRVKIQPETGSLICPYLLGSCLTISHTIFG